ncbi:MAG: methyl-accepting chemotaxis protein [Candidatus Eremiobacteraeota bacterium]|nr:methyl-accepting chemotaxis protein [Candidatus Eremiobacteraeota bacterium]
MPYNVGKSIFERTAETPAATAPAREKEAQAPPSGGHDDLTRSLLDELPLPVVAVDRDFNVIYANRAAQSITGMAQEQCLQSKCFSLMHTGHCNTENCQLGRAMIQGTALTGETVARLPRGDLPIRYTAVPLFDNNGKIAGAVEYILDISKELEIKNAITDLTKAAVNGQLDRRAETSGFQGAYREIVEGFNSVLDSVVKPLKVAASYVNMIAKGEIPPKITDEYRGDFNEIKNNLNQCIDAVNLLVADANMLSKAGVEGRLATRADGNKHQGEFRRIVQGVNDTLDAVIGPLGVAAKYVERISRGDIPEKIRDEYKGDFNEIKNNLNQCIDAVNLLVADANMLSKAGVEGRLATRADGNKHQGEFRRIVQGVNDTLDAVIGPLGVAAKYVERISRGDIPEKIRDEYKGDFNEIKNNLNALIDSMDTITNVAKEIAGGNLEVEVRQRSSQDMLMKAIEAMLSNLKSMVKGIMEMTISLTASSSQLSSIAEELAQNAVGMSNTSTSVASSAEEMSVNMASISASTEQSTTNINGVASATEEMSSTIGEISQNSERARSITQNAVQSVNVSSEKVKELGAAAKDISKVTDVIVEIAEQTKLLALNATIEAARAGEAGKGFAVVANEVKELAKQTNAATDDIMQKIEAIQASTNHTIGQISEISKIILTVSETVSNIASSVEEQSVTTKSIARNIGQALIGVNDSTKNIAVAANMSRNIASDIGSVKEGIDRIKEAGKTLTSSSGNLVQVAGRLKVMVERFKV